MTSPAGAFPDYFALVEVVDTRGATDLVVGLLDEGSPLPHITREVLGPAQVRVGQLWERGDWSVADEHAATSVTEQALSALTHAGLPRRTTHRRHVAVACAEGEWHALPARMAAAVAASGECRVTELGPSMPAAKLHRRLATGDIDLLALSCTMPSNLIGAARGIMAAHEAGVPVMVGGRAFGLDDRRARALGADAWSADPAALLNEPPPLCGALTEIPLEALLLDAVDATVISLANERLLEAFPHLVSMTAEQQQRTAEDLVWMARFTAAAVLTRDPRIVEDLLTWLIRLLRGRVSDTVVTSAALTLAEVLEPQAPYGASILQDAAERVALRGSP